MQGRPIPQTNMTPANRFRSIIQAAVAAGVDLSGQVLQLTHGDGAKLKRDPSVRDDEIRFRDGVMEFIGVRVVEGAAASGLAEASEIITPPNPSKTAASAKAKTPRPKAVRKPSPAKPKTAEAAPAAPPADAL